MLLDLTDHQRLVLAEVLNQELKVLLGEIAAADSREYKDKLRARHTELENVLFKLVQMPAVPIDVGPLG